VKAREDYEVGGRYRVCRHRPDQTYTRYPCNCGRELWPPRGRGRGESLLSPRRIEAKLKAIDANEMHIKGASYARNAVILGYKTPSGAWRAVQRIRDHEAAWRRWEDRQRQMGGRPRERHGRISEWEYQQVLAQLEYEAAGGLDGERLDAATTRLRRLPLDHGRRSCAAAKRPALL
jgi:hypothetical protein